MVLAFLSAMPSVSMAEDEVNQVPYSETFDTQEAFDKFMVLDNNYDYSTWEWDDEKMSARYSYDSSYDADDWLLTPMIRLNPGQYVISYKATNYVGRRASYDEKLATAYGIGTDPSKYTELLPTTVISHGDTLIQHEITVSEVEDVRIGFHALSDAGQYYLWIDDINVKAAAKDATPDSVTALTATAAPKGALNATLSFTAPAKASNGNDLTSLTKIEVLRNDTALIKTIDAPQPGTAYTVNDASPVNGFNKYTVTAYNETGKGVSASVSCFVGQDVPLKPENIAVKDNFDGSLKLTWDAPQGEKGKNGRYVNPDALLYKVYEVQGQQLNLLADSVENHELTINVDNDDQQFRYYQVSALTTGGESDMDMSNEIITGASYKLPFTESVNDGKTSMLWWTEHLGYTNFIQASGSKDADGTNGYFAWYPYGDSQAWLNTGKVSVSDASNPQLVFNYYALCGKANQLKIEVMRDFLNTDTVLTIDMASLAGTDGWRKASVDLAPYKDSHYIIVKFHGISRNTADETMALDNIRLYDAPAVDLSARLIGPSEVNVNDKAALTVAVTNNGSEDISNANVKLYKGSELINEWNDLSVSALADTLLTYEYQTVMPDKAALDFNAVVTADKDADNSNDKSNVVTVKVVKPDMQTASNLTASKGNDGVELSWQAPDFGDGTVTDGFEKYGANTITGFGDWSTIDADGAKTLSVDEFDFPAMGEPFAYLCFNPGACGIDTYTNAEFAAHSGNQYMASFMNDPINYSDVQNDDWLVSPELIGEGQTVKFWAKSMLDGEFAESFEVRYSLTDTARTSFTLLDTHANIGADWTEYTAQLPEGAKYFAIRCISDQKFIFCVDDATFRQKIPEVLGYNIYRGNTFIGSVDGSTESYVDSEGNVGDDYYVTVIYAKGESDVSNEATVTDGIETISGNDSNSASGRGVYTISGIHVADSLGNVHNLKPGLYIVNGRKVIVR